MLSSNNACKLGVELSSMRKWSKCKALQNGRFAPPMGQNANLCVAKGMVAFHKINDNYMHK